MAAKRTPDIPKNNPQRQGRQGRPSVSRKPDIQNKNRPAAVSSHRPRVKRHPDGNAPVMSINEQTPSKRRALREAKKINSRDPEIRRGAKKAQEYKIKKKKKGLWRVAFVYAALFVVVLAAVAGVISLGFFINLNKVEPSPYEGLKLKMCLEHEAAELKAVSVDIEKYIIDDKFYVNMTALAKEFGFIVTGDRNWLRFITDEKTGESVCFEVGTPFAEVNGTEIRLNGAAIDFDGYLFVPVEFFREYVNGIEITLDEEKNVLYVLRDTYRNEAGHFDEAAVDFTLKPVKDSASISEFELSDEIKERCYFIPMITPPETEPVPAT